MKIAKYVVIAQMVLSAILVVIFVTRSMASNKVRAKADEQAAAGAHAEAGHDGEKVEKTEHGEKAEKAQHGEKAEHAEKAAEGHKAEATEHGEEAAGEEAGKKPHPTGRLAANEGSETPEFTLDVVKGEGAHEADDAKAKKPSEERGRPGKGRDKDKDRGKDRDRKGEESDPTAGFGSDPKQVALNLLAGNARFADGRRNPLDLVEQREVSAGGQHPGVMVLGCADSRVPPELIFDRGVGEMFVVRSAGNIAEPVAVGSLEYAAEHLHTKVLLVLGHEKCGAVQAALSEAKLPSTNLEAMVDAISPAVRELKAWVSGDQLIHMAVEANVRRQADEVLRRSALLRAAVARKELTVLKAVYDLQTGRVRPL
jgi:carbonic anhydrase